MQLLGSPQQAACLLAMAQRQLAASDCCRIEQAEVLRVMRETAAEQRAAAEQSSLAAKLWMQLRPEVTGCSKMATEAQLIVREM